MNMAHSGHTGYEKWLSQFNLQLKHLQIQAHDLCDAKACGPTTELWSHS